MQPKRSPTESGLPVVAALLVFTVLFFWLNRGWLAVAGDSVAVIAETGQADARLIVWVLDWVFRSLVTDWSVLVDAPINHPAPAQLTGSEHFGSTQLLYAPIRMATGNPILAANLTAMLCYPLAATAMYAFLRAAGVATMPAFVSGVMLALGPFQTPGNLHILQYLPLYFPLAVVALLRLRQSPALGRAIVLVLALTAAMTSSYYTAMMLCAAFVPWALVEIGTAPRRRGFMAIAATSALLVAIAALVILSLPYLDRAAAAAPRTPLREYLGEWSWSAAIIWSRLKLYALDPGPIGLAPSLMVASLLGGTAFFEQDLRRYASAALLVTAAGLFLLLGGTGLVASYELPGPIGALASLADRFFSVYPRATLLLSFAGSVLAGLGLETVRRRFPLVGNAAATILLGVVLASTGRTLGAPVLIEVDSYTVHRAAYARIGEIISARGGGSLLELPRLPGEARNDSRAMMGQLVHQAPLITGHTGYQPPGRAEVDELIRRLPDGKALDQLARTTGLRWIVLRPTADWRFPRRYSELVRRLQAQNWVRGSYPAGALLLLELRDRAEMDRVGR